MLGILLLSFLLNVSKKSELRMRVPLMYHETVFPGETFQSVTEKRILRFFSFYQ